MAQKSHKLKHNNLKPSANIPDAFYTDETEVSCDGGGGALGHPLIYLELADNGEATCPYCSRKFIHKA